MGEAARGSVRRTAGKCATEAAQAFYELYLSMLNGLSEGKAQATRTCARCSTARATACAATACCARSAGSGICHHACGVQRCDPAHAQARTGRADRFSIPLRLALCASARADARDQQRAVCAARAPEPSAAAGGKPEPARAAVRGHHRHPAAARRGSDAGRDRPARDERQVRRMRPPLAGSTTCAQCAMRRTAGDRAVRRGH